VNCGGGRRREGPPAADYSTTAILEGRRKT
jgi:hypothetical protein